MNQVAIRMSKGTMYHTKEKPTEATPILCPSPPLNPSVKEKSKRSFVQVFLCLTVTSLLGCVAVSILKTQETQLTAELHVRHTEGSVAESSCSNDCSLPFAEQPLVTINSCEVMPQPQSDLNSLHSLEFHGVGSVFIQLIGNVPRMKRQLSLWETRRVCSQDEWSLLSYNTTLVSHDGTSAIRVDVPCYEKYDVLGQCSDNECCKFAPQSHLCVRTSRAMSSWRSVMFQVNAVIDITQVDASTLTFYAVVGGVLSNVSIGTIISFYDEVSSLKIFNSSSYMIAFADDARLVHLENLSVPGGLTFSGQTFGLIVKNVTYSQSMSFQQGMVSSDLSLNCQQCNFFSTSDIVNTTIRLHGFKGRYQIGSGKSSCPGCRVFVDGRAVVPDRILENFEGNAGSERTELTIVSGVNLVVYINTRAVKQESSSRHSNQSIELRKRVPFCVQKNCSAPDGPLVPYCFNRVGGINHGSNIFRTANLSSLICVSLLWILSNLMYQI